MGVDALGVVLATAVDCVVADLKRSKQAQDRVLQLDETFAGQMLPLLCSLFSTDDSRGVRVFCGPSWTLLQSLRALNPPADNSASPSPEWAGWLEEQTRWLLLYLASSAHVLLAPPGALVPGVVRRAYASLWALFDCEAAVASDEEGGRWGVESIDGNSQREDWLQLARAMGSALEDIPQNATKNPSGTQWVVSPAAAGAASAKNVFPTFSDAFTAIDGAATAGLRKTCSWIFENEVWTSFFERCAYAGNANKLVTSVLASVAPADGESSKSLVQITSNSADFELAVYLRRTLFSLLLHSHGVDSATETAESGDFRARLWAQALLLTMTVLSLLPGGLGDFHVRKTMLSHMCSRAQSLLELPLRPLYAEGELCLTADVATASKEQFFLSALSARTHAGLHLQVRV